MKGSKGGQSEKNGCGRVSTSPLTHRETERQANRPRVESWGEALCSVRPYWWPSRRAQLTDIRSGQT